MDRQLFVKRESETDAKYGKNPRERTVSELLDCGVVCLNKPQGPTSHQVADYVQKMLKIKTGHGGSLDPNVTGVLPMALGRATRIMSALLIAGKEYVCIMQLHDDVPEKKIREALESFKGKITQLPPVKSSVARRLREREIYYLDVLEIDERRVLFKMGCEAGTYVRKVCHDVGQKLGCGAHMAELVRTKAGPFASKEWVSLQDLEDAFAFWQEEKNEKFLRHCVKPVEFAVQHLPKVWIHDTAVDTVCHGATLKIPGVAKLDSFRKGEIVAVMTLKDELVGIGESTLSAVQIMTDDKGSAVNVHKVFMPVGVYPKVEAKKQ